MSLTRTTLASAIGPSDTTWKLTSTSGFPAVGTISANQRVQVDGEVAIVTGVPVSGTITVRARGYDGTAAMAHDAKASVVTSAVATDWPATVPSGHLNSRPANYDEIVTIATDATLTIPARNTTYLIKKATALALTLPAPSTAEDGRRLTFTAEAAAAHVITATGLLGTGASTTDTATFAAQLGAGCVLVADNGKWNAVSATGITFA